MGSIPLADARSGTTHRNAAVSCGTSPCFRPKFLLNSIGLAALLAACSAGLDPGQRRICRALPQALEAEGTRIQIAGEGRAAAPYQVEITYDASDQGMAPRRAFVRCGFGDGAMGRLDLVRAEDAEGRLSDIKLQVLKRWWLPYAEPRQMLTDLPAIAARPPAAAGYFLQILINAVPLAAIDALLALAYALVYGLIGRVLFGFGEIAVTGGFASVIGIALAFAAGSGAPPAMLGFGLLLAVAVSTLAGRAMAEILARPLAERRGLALVVASIGLAIAVPEGLRLAQGADDRWVRPMLREPILLADASGFTMTATPVQGLVVVLATAAIAALFIVMRRTAAGRVWRAVAEDGRTASLLGIDRWRVMSLTFAASGALSGLAGFLLVASYGGIGFASGLLIGLKALLAAVVGGVGSLGGAVLAGALVGIAETFWSGYAEIAYKDVAILAMLVLLLVLRPGGLLGFAGRTPRPV